MRILEEGENILRAYEVERFIGEGAFAQVYRVRHRFLGRQAMKVLKRSDATVKETEAMLGEAILLSQIGHPNIVRVFNADVFEKSTGTYGFFTMEYVAGGTLEKYWRSFDNHLVPIEKAIEVAVQICKGLSVAHAGEPPIVHRDIKPQNILVGYDGAGIRVRLSDFGLAKKVNPLTLLASAQGTLAFKPPEFLEHMDSMPSDIWAVGASLYLLLTDQLPYLGLDEEEFLSGKRWTRPVIPPSRLNIDIDPALNAIVMTCLALEPDRRYQNALELLEDLQKWKPQPAAKRKDILGTSTIQKSALGRRISPNREYADKMIERALKLAGEPNKLIEAADILEEAINAAPELRGKYGYRVSLWRKGLSM